jgi:cytoskeletal protein CcmA (bactofilin family)
MLQKDSLFRRNDSFFRSSPPLPPAAPATTGTVAQPAAEPAKPVADKGEERKESKLIVGPDIKMKGVEVADCDTLVVEGRIEATLDSRVLQIAQNGTFCGTVAVDTAEIHGRLEGDLTVRKQLVIHATGKVSGKIRYAKIKVEEGAELAGEISMMERGAPSVQGMAVKRTGT